MRRLNQELLPAAARHLGHTELAGIATDRLALKSLDAGQRIAWLVASLSLHTEGTLSELIDFVGKSQTRAVQLGVAFYSQSERYPGLQALAPPVLVAFITGAVVLVDVALIVVPVVELALIAKPVPVC